MEKPETGKIPAGRAATFEEKQAVMNGLLALWAEVPALRLGQLLYHAADQHCKDVGRPRSDGNVGDCLFYLEDQKLVELVGVLNEKFKR